MRNDISCVLRVPCCPGMLYVDMAYSWEVRERFNTCFGVSTLTRTVFVVFNWIVYVSWRVMNVAQV